MKFSLNGALTIDSRVSALWRDPLAWARQSILKFSSNRSIRDYCERVWKVESASRAE
jgi:starch phosphorylase